MQAFKLSETPFASTDTPEVFVTGGQSPYINTSNALKNIDLSPAKGKRVLLKPNIGRIATPDSGVITNPQVVAATIDAFQAAGADVHVGESPITGVDTLEAFNTDGLRSLGKTLSIPFMKEKTLRYPGHANLMRVFRDSGFFDAAPIAVDGKQVIPLALTSSLLFDQWRLDEGEEDFTVMRVIIEGRKEGANLCYTYDLLDKYDKWVCDLWSTG